MDICVTIVPAYIDSEERSKYLPQALLTIVNQSYPTVGLVIDDDSPKPYDVESIVNSTNANGMLRYVKRQRQSNDLHTASNALNFGIDLILERKDGIFISSEKDNIRGICYLHSDDLLPKESNLNRIKSTAKSGFSYAYTYVVDSNLKPIFIHGCGPRIPGHAFSFPHHSVMWSFDFLSELRSYTMAKYHQNGLFDCSITCGEDRDVSLSALELCRKIGKRPSHLGRIGYIYRLHKRTVSGATTNSQKLLEKKFINRKHGLRSDSLSIALSRLTFDLPWSIATFLPEICKAPLRKFREKAKQIICNDLSGIP